MFRIFTVPGLLPIITYFTLCHSFILNINI